MTMPQPRPDESIAPLHGVRVVELGFWVAGPSAAGLLADWGADVIKIEPPTGDPLRSFLAADDAPTSSPAFELDNRGKRSVCLDVHSAAGRAIAHDLIAAADVFVTNLRPAALARLGLDYESLQGRWPGLVYASVTGYGSEGPEAGRASFDTGAFWSRAGVARALAGPDGPPPVQRGGMGDHWAGMSAAAGVCAALLQRTKTGRGQHVSTSLLRVGAYTVGWDLDIELRTGTALPHFTRDVPGNPLYNSYRTRDGSWIWLLCLQPDRHLEDVKQAVGLTAADLEGRFGSADNWAVDSAELVARLEAVFATKTATEWAAILDAHGVWWAPVQSPSDLLTDPQAEAAGCSSGPRHLRVRADPLPGRSTSRTSPLRGQDPRHGSANTPKRCCESSASTRARSTGWQQNTPFRHTHTTEGKGSMSAYRYLTYESLDEGKIVRILLNRPKSRNAQNRGLLEELDRAFMTAEADDAARVVILGGVGPAFSSGHDLGSSDERDERTPGPDQLASFRANGGTRSGAEARMLQEWHYYLENTRRWRNLRKITIAQVQGPVIAGGLMLMWCCDLIVASEDARFIDLVGSKLGMCGVEYFAHPWEFGPRKAKELLLTGDYLDARDAHALGMVAKVFPDEALTEKTVEFARRVAALPSMTGLLIKESVNQTVDNMGFHNALQACFSLHQLNHSHWAEVHENGAPFGLPEDGLPDWGNVPRPTRAEMGSVRADS